MDADDIDVEIRGCAYATPPRLGEYMCPECLTWDTITAEATWLGGEGVWAMRKMERCLRCNPLESP